MSVPVVDLEVFLDGTPGERDEVADRVARACADVGFFSVVGHGVDDEIVERAHRAALQFFDLPLEDRLTAAKPHADAPYGYAPLATEALNASIGESAVPDLKETYNVGPIGTPPRPIAEMTDGAERDTWAPTVWPSAMPELRPALESYYRAMSELARTLMDVFARALGQDAGAFDRYIRHHGSALRLAHYPPLDEAPDPGALRAGAHTDYGTLTILRLDAEPGLQVERRPGEWVDVDAPDGALLVNLGDLMQRWSNDRWRSAMHRVIVPEGRHGQRRLTMPFFHNADWDAVIECITEPGEEAKHPPIVAGAHLLSKFRSTVL